jgi:hypothetical protein
MIANLGLVQKDQTLMTETFPAAVQGLNRPLSQELGQPKVRRMRIWNRVEVGEVWSMFFQLYHTSGRNKR